MLNVVFQHAIKNQNFKQADLASVAGVTPSALSKFIAGQKTIAGNKLLKIAPILSINPDYLTGKSQNPFMSNDLIKYRLPESIYEGIDYSIIHFIAEHNRYLSIVYFLSSSPRYSKSSSNAVFEYPVFAIGLKDADGNIFLIKRKTQYPLVGERELIAKLSDIAEQRKLRIVKNHHLLSSAQKIKFTDFSVKKADIAVYFDTRDDSLIDTKESDLTKYIRENNIDPQKILDFLKAIRLS